MTVRVYRWDDASAPTLHGQSGVYALLNVLDACLVTGYGSKAPAGWSKPFSGTGKAVYRPGAGTRFYYRFDLSTSSMYPQVRAYESMTGVDTGTGDFPTTAQFANGLYVVASNSSTNAPRMWVIIATERCFYLYIDMASAASSLSAIGTSYYGRVSFFGDFVPFNPTDAYCALIIADISASAYNYFGLHSSSLSSAAAGRGRIAARNYTQSGTASPIDLFSDYVRAASNATMGAGGMAYPDPVTGGLQLAPILVADSGACRGYLPGAYCPLSNIMALTNCGDTFTGAGAMSGKTFLLLNVTNYSTVGRIAFEISDTW